MYRLTCFLPPFQSAGGASGGSCVRSFPLFRMLARTPACRKRCPTEPILSRSATVAVGNVMCRLPVITRSSLVAPPRNACSCVESMPGQPCPTRCWRHACTSRFVDHRVRLAIVQRMYPSYVIRRMHQRIDREVVQRFGHQLESVH